MNQTANAKAATASAKRISRQAQQASDEGIAAIRNQLDEFDQLVRSSVKERPLLAIATAMLAGYVVGRIVSSR